MMNTHTPNRETENFPFDADWAWGHREGAGNDETTWGAWLLEAWGAEDNKRS